MKLKKLWQFYCAEETTTNVMNNSTYFSNYSETLFGQSQLMSSTEADLCLNLSQRKLLAFLKFLLNGPIPLKIQWLLLLVISFVIIWDMTRK